MKAAHGLSPQSDGRLCQVRGAQPPGVGTNMGRGWRHGLSLSWDPASSGDIITDPLTSGLTHQSSSAKIEYLEGEVRGVSV